MNRRIIPLMAILAAIGIIALRPSVFITYRGPSKWPKSQWALETSAQPRYISPLPKRGNSAAWKMQGLGRKEEVLLQARVESDDTVSIYTSAATASHPVTVLPKYTLHPGEVVTIHELTNFGLKPIEVRLVPEVSIK